MKKLLSLVLAMMMLALVGCGSTGSKDPVVHDHNDPAAEGAKYKTQPELVEAMGMGWNLGNTMDAPEGETDWGQPVTTKEMMTTLKELGYDSIRIPVSWSRHVSEAPEYIIDAEWMARVREVVDYALDAGLIVVINSHHDNEIYHPRKNNREEAVEYLSAIWSQVAKEFKDYDQNLLFESMNEPRLDGNQHEWGLDTNCEECLTAAEVINECNQAFVDVVREAGGKNLDRYLLVSSYAGSPGAAMIEQFRLPEDLALDRILLATHAYSPYDLAMGDNMAINKFDAGARGSIDWFINGLYEKFVSQGVHVVIDEMGIINKNNPEARYEWAKYYVTKAKQNGMVCMVWDNGSTNPGYESYGLYDRRNLKIFDSSEPVHRGFMEAINAED